MALNSSGPISLGGSTTGQSINLELGVSATALASINSTSFRTLAGVASGAISIGNFYGKSNAITGQAQYVTAGTYTWVCPSSGVSSVSVVCVGGGGSACGNSFGGVMAGGGGGLAYLNNFPVTAGASYTVIVGTRGVTLSNRNPVAGGTSSFGSTSIIYAQGGQVNRSNEQAPANGGIGGTFFGATGYGTKGGGQGGNGGGASSSSGSGGGGGGGYSGGGGSTSGYGSNVYNASGIAGTNGGGGGGGASSNNVGAGGGGVGILGQGSSGAGGASSNGGNPSGGGAGSGGVAGYAGQFIEYCGCCGPTYTTVGGEGGAYGGGGGYSYENGGAGGVGAVRIIYPGSTRSFPSTNTGNL